ncbi:SAP domain-containing protein [Streptomyces chartreusis]|uniref:SAP domain-containing protein n=1 Tax=Streptomyces chartreusis TaxID=1969 RepID=UPI003718093B
MTLRVCLDCSTAFAVGVRLCPHCGSERNAEQGTAAAMGIHAGVPVETEEDTMPKITRHGGASFPPDEETAAAEVDGAGAAEPETTDVTPGYEDMTVEQLKEQLAARDLPKSGKRDELVQRLRDDDAATETE